MAAESPDTPSSSASPSPSISPSLALDAVPTLERSVSTPCSTSTTTTSTPSLQSRPSRLRLTSHGSASTTATTVVKRRGYMRPQGTSFADSARHRDSVMSLGSIAHMQYYFARTGLLDGKGAQLANEERMDKLRRGSPPPGTDAAAEPVIAGSALDEFNLSSWTLSWTPSCGDGEGGGGAISPCAVSESGYDVSVVESPGELTDGKELGAQPPMLPPTVSTYKQKPSYTEPLPDMPVLRRELKEALQDACKLLEETQKPEGVELASDDSETPVVAATTTPTTTATAPLHSPPHHHSNGFHEIQGLHLLDIITLAIRAAKNYYTAHTNPRKLYALRPERTIRNDLYRVLDVLKRMAGRNFRGGIRTAELSDIILWIESIDRLLQREEAQERHEAAEREAWPWRHGDWTGRERERDWLFLTSFDPSPTPLPRWPEPSADSSTAAASPPPSDFLRALQDGQRLVQLHNALVARSRRRFGAIAAWHADVGKPYRRAENLRFWIKAAELRWEVRLSVAVGAVARGDDDAEAWRGFDEAVRRWCAAVREELVSEWRAEKLGGERMRAPDVRVEGQGPAETRRRGGGAAAPEDARARPPVEVDRTAREVGGETA